MNPTEDDDRGDSRPSRDSQATRPARRSRNSTFNCNEGNSACVFSLRHRTYTDPADFGRD